ARSGTPPSRIARCRSARRRSTSSRSRSTQARTCRATSTSSAPRRRPSRAWSARPCARATRAPPRTCRAPCPPRAPAPSGGRARRAACLAPLERPLAPDVDVGEREDAEEDEELEEAEPRELVEDHGERVEEHDLDVEEDEEHRRQVEVDGEALRGRRPLRDARLERDPACAYAARRPLREDEAGGDHRRRDRQSEQPVDQKRQPVVEHNFSSPGIPPSDATKVRNGAAGHPSRMKTLLCWVFAGLVGTAAMTATPLAAARHEGGRAVAHERDALQLRDRARRDLRVRGAPHPPVPARTPASLRRRRPLTLGPFSDHGRRRYTGPMATIETREAATLTLTERAADKVRALMAQEPAGEAEVLRVAIRGGGCGGFEYALGF